MRVLLTFVSTVGSCEAQVHYLFTTHTNRRFIRLLPHVTAI
jgi:hypothetical protein